MEMEHQFLKRVRWVFLGLSMGLLYIICNSISAAEINQLKNLEVRSQSANKIQIVLEFSDCAVSPKSFSVTNPPAIVFDFPSVNNKLPKALSNQTLSGGIFKKINVIEDGAKTRMVVDMKQLTVFNTEVTGNVLKITFENSMLDKTLRKKRSHLNTDGQIKSTGSYKRNYEVGKLVVDSPISDSIVGFQELTRKYIGDKISLNFQDIEVRAILQIIAEFSGFNIIASDSVKGNITLQLQNVPWDQALEIILKDTGLDKRQYGNVMLVGPTSEIAAREKMELEAQKATQELGTMKSELIQINYASAEDLAKLLNEKSNSLMTSRGTVSVDKRTNTLLIQDIPAKLSEIKMLLKKLDVAVRQVEISTQIVTADNTLESTLGLRFGGGANAGIGHRRLGVGGSVDRARAIGDFTNAAGQPGMPPSNALITNATNIGVVPPTLGPTVNNSEGLFSDLGAITAGTGFAAAGFNPAKVGLALARLPNGTLLDLELQALEYQSHSKTIARPKLLTQDQNKASVQKGVDIPYLQASSSGATSVAYKTAALKLDVTPHITPDDKISLDLSISNDTQGAIVAAGPVVNTNRIETKVLVDNGETVVLGGVLQVTDNKQTAKVPFFGDLPIIGGLFRSKYAKYNPTELIIFLTPRIINPLLTIQGGRGSYYQRTDDNNCHVPSENECKD
jgi:type IV pilus secretin PilQ/predicted competence protein